MSETSEAVGKISPHSAASVQLNFLIADIRGYTSFTVEHGDEAAARLASSFAGLTDEVVREYEGDVIELRGDEALCVFHSARNALRAAVALQGAFRDAVEHDPSLPLRVGIGMDAGEAIPVEGGFRGGALNLAARLCSIAGAGEVFASETIIGLARKTGGIAFVDRGEVTLKGLSSPVRVIQIAREGELPTELPPLQPILVTHPTNLPDEPTLFIGRERQVRAISELLQQPAVRLVTLIGPGGTGKTRLALQVGSILLHDFRDGVFFINLAPLSDPMLVPSAVADAVGVREEASTPLVDSLIRHFQDKHLLLVVDNCEHLSEVSVILARLLDACRELHILATSRIPLHLAREHEYPVPPLTVPDLNHLPDPEGLSQYEAVALFIERVRAIKPDFQVTNDNAPAVAEICSRLDGLPLAIELAAARIRLFPPSALLKRLGTRLTLLTGGTKDRPARQQTLRATIDWSYSLLSPLEQMLCARLSVFAGGCTFGAAEAICSQDGDVLEGLESLVEKSLVGQAGDDEPRFTMLETIREYGAEKLQEGGDEPLVRGAHAAYYLQLMEEAEPEMEGPDVKGVLEHLEAEHDNLRTALDWLLSCGRFEEAGRLAGALSEFWGARGYVSEARRRLDEVLAAAPDLSHPIRAKLLQFASGPLHMQGESDLAETMLTESLALYREIGDKRGTGRVLVDLGSVARRRRDFQLARALTEEGLALIRETGDAAGVAMAMRSLGILALEEGDLDKAQSIFDSNVASARERSHIGFLSGELMNVGNAATKRGDYGRAQEALEEALELQRANRTVGVPNILSHLGWLALERSDFDRALALFHESLPLAVEMGWVNMIVNDLEGIGQVVALQGQLQEAATLFGAVAALSHIYDIQESRNEHEQERLAFARSGLGEDNWERAFRQGQALSLEEAVALGLSARLPIE